MNDFDYIDNYVSLTYDDGSHPMSPYYNQPEEEEEEEELEEIDEDLLLEDDEQFDLKIKEKEEKKIDEDRD